MGEYQRDEPTVRYGTVQYCTVLDDFLSGTAVPVLQITTIQYGTSFLQDLEEQKQYGTRTVDHTRPGLAWAWPGLGVAWLGSGLALRVPVR